MSCCLSPPSVSRAMLMEKGTHFLRNKHVSGTLTPKHLFSRQNLHDQAGGLCTKSTVSLTSQASCTPVTPTLCKSQVPAHLPSKLHLFLWAEYLSCAYSESSPGFSLSWSVFFFLWDPNVTCHFLRKACLWQPPLDSQLAKVSLPDWYPSRLRSLPS
jgi:hypothetical protein